MFHSMPVEGAYVRCALCGGPFWVRIPPDHDYTELCAKHRYGFRITEDEVIDAHETLRSITLSATLLRLLGVKEVYYREP